MSRLLIHLPTIFYATDIHGSKGHDPKSRLGVRDARNVIVYVLSSSNVGVLQ